MCRNYIVSREYRRSDGAAPNVPRRYLGGTWEAPLYHHRVGIEMVWGWYRDDMEVVGRGEWLEMNEVYNL